VPAIDRSPNEALVSAAAVAPAGPWHDRRSPGTHWDTGHNHTVPAAPDA